MEKLDLQFPIETKQSTDVNSASFDSSSSVCDNDEYSLSKTLEFSVKMEEESETQSKYTALESEIASESLANPIYYSPSKTEYALFSEEKPYKCDQCDNVFNSPSALELHSTEDHDERKVLYTCDTDPVASCDSLNTESPESNEDKPWKCDKCERIFGDLYSLELHVTVHEQDIFTSCKTEFKVNISELQIKTEQIHTVESMCINSVTESPNIQKNDVEVDSGRHSYICVWCKKSFFNVRLFKKHSLTKSITCDSCNMSFECEGLLQVHLNTEHGTSTPENYNESYFECEICTKSFTSRNSIQKHSLTHKADIECDACNMTFNNLRNYKLHKCMEDSKSITCSKCNRLFRYRKSLQNHKCVYTCETCSKTFLSKQKLESHIHTLHTSEKAYTCESCSKSFLSKRGLLYHIRTHTGQKPYTCEICGKFFVSSQNLKNHISSRHTNEKPHTCEICKKSFSLKKYLWGHIRTHIGEKAVGTHNCEICGKCFLNNRSFQYHIRSQHTNDKPHTCEICKKSFAVKWYLQRHILETHAANEKLHICDICNNSYKCKSYLLRHIRTVHTPAEKPHVCKICNKAFRFKHRLQRHNSKHIKVKKYLCEMCNKSFKTESQLDRHKQIHLSETCCTCAICNNIFATKSALKTHIQLMHNK